MIIEIYLICMIIAGLMFFYEAKDILKWDDWADYALLFIYLLFSPIFIIGWIYIFIEYIVYTHIVGEVS